VQGASPANARERDASGPFSCLHLNRRASDASDLATVSHLWNYACDGSHPWTSEALCSGQRLPAWGSICRVPRHHFFMTASSAFSDPNLIQISYTLRTVHLQGRHGSSDDSRSGAGSGRLSHQSSSGAAAMDASQPASRAVSGTLSDINERPPGGGGV